MKKYKSLISMCAFATLANCAKADVEYAQEHQGTGRIVVHDPEGTIGRGNELFKWMIVSPDGAKGFGNDFMTNALSVVTEDGTNYYAHVQGENNDRTKVIHFTVDQNGFPSSQGDVIDTTLSGETNNVAKMQNRKLMGVKNGYLYFYSTDDYIHPFVYFPTAIGNQTKYKEYSDFKKCLNVYQDDSAIYFLCSDERGRMGPEYFDHSEENNYTGFWRTPKRWNTDSNFTDYYTTVISNQYAGTLDGKIVDKTWAPDSEFPVQFPGPVSGLSNNGDEVFATSEATNAFYNVTLGAYNVVKDENGQPKPMIPPTKEGLLRVIDNRKKGGKFLYVTRKGVHSIE